MLAVCEVNVGNDIYYSAVCFLGQALVLAAVARFHVKNRYVKPLRAYYRKTTVGIAEHQNAIRFNFSHQFIRFCDYIAHRLAEVVSHGVKINVRIGKLQIFEKYSV